MSFGIPVRNGLGLGLLASTSLATGNVGGPALYLPFALTGTLDPRITFSRPSLATMYDSTGKLVYAPNNLLTYSNTFSDATWNKGTSTVTTGVSDPLGGTTASTLTANAGNSNLFKTASFVGKMVGSIWLRRRTGSGTVSLYNADVSTTVVTITTSWARYSTASTSTGTAYFGVLLATSGDQVDVAFSQLEAVTYETTPRTFNATTSAAYYGPRFDYNPATLVARGLLIEEARTNTITSSENFSGTGWFVDGAALTPNAGVAPNGTNTATSIVAGTGNNRVYQFDNSGITGNKVASFYVKSNAGSSISIGATGAMSPPGPAVVNSATGTVTGFSGASVVPVRDGWFRVFLPVNVTTASGNSTYWVISGPASSVLIWGWQLEAGAFATSYIPTAASSVARSADSATMTGTNFSSWYNPTQGTFVVSGSQVLTVFGQILSWYLGGQAIVGRNAGSTTEIYSQFGNVTLITATLGGGGLITSPYKVAVAISSSDRAVVGNNGAVVTGAAPTAPVTELGIGSRVDGYSINGHIAAITYYNTRLPNATLQSLTT
jgi:hypothetical protein